MSDRQTTIDAPYIDHLAPMDRAVDKHWLAQELLFQINNLLKAFARVARSLEWQPG